MQGGAAIPPGGGTVVDRERFEHSGIKGFQRLSRLRRYRGWHHFLHTADCRRANAISPGPVITDLAAASKMHEPGFPPLGKAGAADIAARSNPWCR
jgi:hypothetical protein